MIMSLITSPGLLLVLTVMLGKAMVPRHNEVISCLQGRLRCHDNYTCSNLLEDLDDYCDVSALTCTTIYKAQCKAILSSLQTNRYFRSCTCDPYHPEVSYCRDIRNRIFMHACVTTHDVASDPSWHSDTRPQQGAPSPDDLEAIEQTLDKELSCIGVRQLCLKNVECHKAFISFQDTCAMKRDTDLCIARDRVGCFKAIETIRPSGLFNCECRTGMKSYTLNKCERIRNRLTNNPCLTSIPYYVYSSNPYQTTYSQLLQIMTTAIEDSQGNDKESTCVQAFMTCNDDSTCRLRLTEAINACQWNKGTHQCDRTGCMDAIRSFYLLVRPEKTHALLFCRCRSRDYKCEAVRAAMFPTCSVVEDPPPSCLSILQRCYAEEDCRTRWYAYQQYCAYDKKMGGCPAGTDRCRNSQAGIMGTILTTNCTCILSDSVEQKKCLDARNQLQNKSLCREAALNDYHTHQVTTPPAFWADAAAVSDNQDCMRELGHKIPLFMNPPTVIRRYNDESECSEVCQCILNGTLICKKLPCGPSLSCKTSTKHIYAHGASFSHPERGLCRCIRGELVCAKSNEQVRLNPGLFFHVGFSLSDQYLVEANSGVVFNANHVANKFGAILNGDSAEQFCSLAFYEQAESNLVFEIRVADNSPLDNKQEGCITPAKMLSSKVNSRDPVIVTDAELSIIKVAQLERVLYYKGGTPPTVQSMQSRRSAACRFRPGWRILLIVCLLVSLLPVMWHGDRFTNMLDNTDYQIVLQSETDSSSCDKEENIHLDTFHKDNLLRKGRRCEQWPRSNIPVLDTIL